MPEREVTEVVSLVDGSLSGEGVAVAESRGLGLIGQVESIGTAPGVPSGTRAVSIFLVNRRAGEAQGCQDASYAFQVELELRCDVGFAGREDRSGEGSDRDPDDQIGDLQYRGIREYGVGHGVSVDIPAGQSPVTRVKSTWLPRQGGTPRHRARGTRSDGRHGAAGGAPIGR